MKPDMKPMRVPHDPRSIMAIALVLLLGLVLGVMFFVVVARAFTQ